MDILWHMELSEANAIWQDEHENDAAERKADQKRASED